MSQETIPSVRRSLKQLLVFIGIAVLLGACVMRTSPQPNEQGLIAGLKFTPNHVIIDNGNDYVWKLVTIQLNESYRYETDVLPRGASSVPLHEFRDSSGNPFDPQKLTPHRLTLKVQDGFNGKPDSLEW